MRYKYYTVQMDEEDCGVAALSMVLKNFGTNVSIAKLRTSTKTTIDGTTIYGIVQAAKIYGLDTLAIKANRQLFEINHLPLPFIIHVIRKESYLHYCVVTEINGDQITVADPDDSVGIKRLSIKKVCEEWSENAILFSKGDDYQSINEKSAGIFEYIRYLTKNRFVTCGIVLMAALVLLTNIINSLAIQLVIDRLIPGQAFNKLTFLVIGLISMYFFNATFSFVESIAMTILGQRLSKDIALNFIKHLFDLPIDFFATRRTGDVVSRFNDTNRVIEALSRSIVTIFLDVLIVMITGYVLGLLNFRLLLIIGLFIPIYTVTIVTFASIFEKMNKKVMIKNAKLSSLIIDSIKGMETLKCLNANVKQLDKIKLAFNDFLNELKKYSILTSSQESIKQFLQLTLNILVIWIGANQIMNNYFKLGQLIAFTSLLGYFTNSLKNILDLQSNLQSAIVATRRLNDILIVPVEKEIQLKTVSNDISGDIVLSGVQCRYGYQDLVLKGIDLEIKKGNKIAIVGTSGSGKSTIAKLLVGLLTASQGSITLNGINIEKISRSLLRSEINYVPQYSYIISDTIWNNLTLGCSDKIDREKVEKACRIAMISETINALPLGYETKLDEEATILSGGQKQRLTIARAILSNAQTLILDESTSSLDTITERELINNLLNLKDKTIIFIVHRLKVAKQVDDIVVIENGTVVERGSHNQLMAQHKRYYDFVRLRS